MNGLRLLYRESKAAVWAFSFLCAIPLFPEFCAPVFAMIALAFATADAHKRGRCIRIGGVGKILLLYVAYLAVTILFSPNKLNSLATVAMWVLMFCCYLTVTTVAVSRRRIRIFLLLFSIAAGIVGGIAFVQYVLRDICLLEISNQVWLPVDDLFYQYFPIKVNPYLAFYRSAATFNNPNVMAEFLVMAIPFAVLCGFEGHRTRTKLVARLSLLLAITGVAISFSRGAYLATILILLLVVITNLRRITPFVLSIIAAISLIPDAIISRFLSISNTSEVSISQRFKAWELAVQAILQAPLTGRGCGIMPFWNYAQASGLDIPHSHNLILQVLLEGGLTALCLLAWAAIQLLRNSMELLSHSSKTHLCGTCLLAFGAAFLVFGMVDYPFLCPKLIGPFLTIIGFADAAASLYLKKPSTPLKQLFKYKR